MNSDELVANTYFFVSSQNADDTSNNANIRLIIPEASLRCKADEYMRITLEQHCMINQLYNVTEGIVGTNTIPQGSYSFCQLQRVMNELPIPGIKWKFDSTTNKWTVTNSGTDAVTLDLSMDMTRLLGLDSPINIAASPSGTVMSTRQAIPTLYTELLFSLGEVSIAPLNLTNVGLDPDPENIRQQVRNTNTIGIIPITAAPCTLNTWTNLNRTFEARLYGENVSSMQFITTDVQGQLVTNLPPWTATFNVQVFRRPGESIEAKRLAAIEEYARLVFLLGVATSKLDVIETDLLADSDIIDPRLTVAEQEEIVNTVLDWTS